MDTQFAEFVTEFQRRLDAAESLADMLSPDARLISPAGVLEGAAAIESWVTARRPEQRVRHLWNNMRVERGGEPQRATLRYIATAWHGTAAGVPGMMTLGDVVDVLVPKAGGGWALLESRFDRIFKQNIVQES